MLIVSLSSAVSPFASTVIFCDRSPSRDRRRHRRDVSHLAREITGQRVHVVRQILPRAGDTGHVGLSAELSFGSDFARNARYFRGECAELIDHDVDRVLQLEDFALRISGDLSRQIALARQRS